MWYRQSFTPQVQDSDGQSSSKHFDEESRDYLPSNSHENQWEDDRKSTDDDFDRFTDHQVHLSTSRQWLCLLCTTSFFFSPIDWNNFCCKNFGSLYTFLFKNMRNKHLATFTQNLKVIETTGFFSPIYFVGAPVFLPQHWKLLGPERLMPLKLSGMNRVNILTPQPPYKTVTYHWEGIKPEASRFTLLTLEILLNILELHNPLL